MAPKDEDELVDMLWTALQHHGPILIRYPRGAGAKAYPIKQHPANLPIGQAEVLQHGTDVAVIFYGAVAISPAKQPPRSKPKDFRWR